LSRKPRIGIALGSGAGRGWAHLGILSTLEAAGIQLDIVCGTSIGALVGGAYVGGRMRELEDWARGLTTSGMARLFDFRLQAGGIIAGRRIPQILHADLHSRAIEDLDRPTIAAINGIAYGGGCEISLCCDFRVIAEDTSIGVPEIKIGLLPGAGGTQRLPRMLPTAIAKQMIYTGDPLTAQQALQHGLVNEIAPAGQALEVATQWARKLLKLPPVGLRCAKLLVDIAQNSGLKTGIEAERQAMAFLYATEDRKEGLAAFLERREAKFSGR